MSGEEALGIDQIVKRKEKESLLKKKNNELFLEHFRFTTKLSRK